ncbi:Gti1/Pac2 family-domain-containing protein [Amylocystis lapponica]|nr:Gti1/Pac2 family-domain-containing protein [Amylocystis lapponica]
MQQPTCMGIRIRSRADSHVIFHAVTLGLLPMVARRLEPAERQYVCTGSVFVWEERCSTADATAAGIERWTDGRRWGASRVRDDFLFYQEKLPEIDSDSELASLMYVSFPWASIGAVPISATSLGSRLVKQTSSVYVQTPAGRRKWHLVAYSTQVTLDSLDTVDDIPELAALQGTIPEGQYIKARTSRNRSRRERGGTHARRTTAQTQSVSASALYTSSDRDSPSVSQWGTPPTPAAPTQRRHSDPPAARYPDPHQARELRRRSPYALAPLLYLRTIPYTPRHPIDSVALRAFDCTMR